MITTALRQAAAEVAYDDSCESGGDFRFGMERRFPEIEMDDIRSLWRMAKEGTL